MKIIITGATGFLGSHVLDECLRRGHTVYAITRSHSNRTACLHANLRWIVCSLDEVPSSILQECDALLHLAAHSVLYPFDNISNCITANLSKPLVLLEKAHDAGVKRFVIAGSCFEYGLSGEGYKEIPTDAVLKPTNTYAASKAAASIVFNQWALQNSLSLDILRIFHLFGEGEPEKRFWPSLRKAAFLGEDYKMTHGEQVRDFMEVCDVANVFVDRIEISCKLLPGPRTLNLATDNPMSLKKFASYWWNKWNAKGSLLFGEVPYRDNEVMQFVPGPDLLKIKSFLQK
jgi:nucleoside-diphosphate-sugar epimerase